MEGSESGTQGQQSKDELLEREEDRVGLEEDEENEFLREGRVARLGPAAGHLRKQSPPGYRVTEKEEKHQQKVKKKNNQRWKSLNSFVFLCCS